MSLTKEFPTILQEAFPGWQPLLPDGLFFLRDGYAGPVKYKFALYRRDPVAPDGIVYKSATITDVEVRAYTTPDALVAEIVSRLRAAEPVSDQAAEPERAAESA